MKYLQQQTDLMAKILTDSELLDSDSLDILIEKLHVERIIKLEIERGLRVASLEEERKNLLAIGHS